MDIFLGEKPTFTESERCNHLLAGLSTDVRGLLEPSLILVKLKRRYVISNEGFDSDYIYFPESCVISESKSLADGRMLELALIGREGATGLIEMFTSESGWFPTRRVVETGFAFRITKAEFRALLTQDDRLRKALGPYVSKYLTCIYQQSVCSSFHSVRQRLCLRLMMIYERSASLLMSATHEEVAHALGVFRPTVSILSQEMRRDGLIKTARGKIQIEDLKRLRSEACECYGQFNNPKLPAFV